MRSEVPIAGVHVRGNRLTDDGGIGGGGGGGEGGGGMQSLSDRLDPHI